MKSRILLFLILFGTSALKAQLIDTAAVKVEIEEARNLSRSDLEAGKNKFLEIFDKISGSDFDYGKYKTLNNIGNYYFHINDYKNALNYFLRASEHAKNLHDAEALAKCYFNISLCLSYVQELSECIKYSLKSLDHAKRSNNTEIVVRNGLHLSFLYMKLGEIDKGLDSFEQYFDMSLSLKDSSNVIYGGVGICGFPYIDYDKERFEKYLSIIAPYYAGAIPTLKVLYLSAKALHSSETQSDSTQHYLAQIETLMPTQTNQEMKALSYTFIGELYFRQAKYERSKAHYALAIQNGEPMHGEPFLEPILPRLIEIEEQLGNFERAYEYSKQFADLKRKLTTKRNEQLIAKINSKYKSSEKDNEILAQKMKIQEQNSNLMERKFKFTTSIIGLVLIGLFVFCYFLFNDAKQKSNYNTFLKEHNKKLKEADATKSKFIDSITHELRTPLYTITGLVELLRSTDNEVEIGNYLNTLSFSNNYLSNFIDNMISLNASKETNAVSLAENEINIKGLIKGVTNSIRIIGTTNKIIEQIDHRIPEAILGDQLKLSQILFNLVNNANKFTTKGLVCLRLMLDSISDDKVSIRFEVEDNGIGIRKDDFNKVFKQFFRGDTGENGHYDGTGIGLSVVKSFIELHDSQIFMESEVGKGSKFYFTISFKILKDSNVKVEKVPSNLVKKVSSPVKVIKPVQVSIDQDGNVQQDKSKKKLDILLVEDNRINQMIIQKIIVKNGWNCKVAKNGKVAVEMARADNFDLILMDIMMPVMDGFEATREIKKFNTVVPIIALTAVSKKEHKDTFKEIGIEVVISKPVDPPTLLKLLENQPLGTKAIV